MLYFFSVGTHYSTYKTYKHAGSGRDAGRSLYAHFFSRSEEQGIYGRLAGMPQPPALFPRSVEVAENAPKAVFTEVGVRRVA